MDRMGAPWSDPDDADGNQSTDPATGALQIVHDDGTVTIDFNGPHEAEEDDGPDPNLADKLSDHILAEIEADLIDAIEADEQSGSEWRNNVAQGLNLLGLVIKRMSSGSSVGVEGLSQIIHPMLLEAVLRAWATSSAEMLPSGGPVKVASDDEDPYVGSSSGDDQANALEKDLNHYLTVVENTYRQDTSKLLLYRAYCGAGFKKVYRSPLRNRPVSESVSVQHMIISDGAVSLEGARRVTQVIPDMKESTYRRLVILGVYRDIDEIPMAADDDNAVDERIRRIEGISKSNRQEDEGRTIWECYCELDIQGYEHKIDGKPSGLPLPYRVSIDKAAGRILEIRSNSDDDIGKDELPKAREVFVQWDYVPGFGFWPIGLLHILGNTTEAVTKAWRVMMDAGSFSNFPAMAYMQTSDRQVHNNFRLPPGGAVPIRAAGDVRDIRQLLMALPYKEISPVFMTFADKVASSQMSAASAADMQVGEGRQDAPVGTTLALIEQATKVEAASHKNAHDAQAKELQLLKRLFKEDPEALWRDNPKAQIRDKQMVLDALENANIVPVSDPNTPSHLHRMAKLSLVDMLATKNPQLYDRKAVDTMIYEGAGFDPNVIQSLFAPPMPPQQPQMDPSKLLDAQVKREGFANTLQTTQMKIQDAAADRKSKENLELLRMANESIIHPEGTQAAQSTLRQMAPITDTMQ